MRRTLLAHRPVSGNLILTAVILLVGVTLLIVARSSGNRVMLLAGFLVTGVGVVRGVLQVGVGASR